MKKTFLEFVGNASTTAWYGTRTLGRYVSVAAYENETGSIVLCLENNGTKVKGIPPMVVDRATYECFKDNVEAASGRPLFIRAIELFGATAYLDRREDQ